MSNRCLLRKMRLKREYLILLFCCQLAYAQDFNKIQNIRFDGDEFFEVQKYHLALPYYKKVLELAPDDVDANYKVGICYLNSTHSREALPYFEKILNAKDLPDDVYYDIARSYHIVHEFDKAIEKYQEAKKHLVKGGSITQEMIDREIKRCEFGKELVSTPLDFNIENVGDVINSEYRDHVPVVSADETSLIFTSRRPETTGGKVYSGDGMYFEDIYISKKGATDEWMPPSNIGEGINTKRHDASVGVSPDGQKLFIYRSIQNKNHYRGDIYSSDWDPELGVWSEPVPLPDGINSHMVELSTSITSDENVMYFSSNRPGGKGGYDIYQVKKLPNGDWAAPLNMESINTPDDEDAPFIHSDNRTLYFSSKGHQTMGGYDIFMSIYNETKDEWSEPQNMGYPVNTASDDIYFVWSADGMRGYFSSAREDSYGDLDIYVIHRPIIGKYFMVLKGTLIDEDSRQPVSGLIKLYNAANEKLVGVFNTNMNTGKFSAIIPPNAVYRAEISARGYEDKTELIVVPDVTEYFEHEITIHAGKKIVDSTASDSSNTAVDTAVVAKADTEVVVENSDQEEDDEEGALNPGDLIKMVFHDFDQAAHSQGSGINIDDVIRILKENPWLVISVESHTDSKGSEEYNMKLAQRRASSCQTYLLRKGISATRVKVRYYGEERPLEPNEKPNGADNPDGRAKNRRTEFRVVSNKPF